MYLDYNGPKTNAALDIVVSAKLRSDANET